VFFISKSPNESVILSFKYDGRGELEQWGRKRNTALSYEDVVEDRSSNWPIWTEAVTDINCVGHASIELAGIRGT
jgi:hypothetical protein